jgi:hypothetical protein
LAPIEHVGRNFHFFRRFSWILATICDDFLNFRVFGVCAILSKTPKSRPFWSKPDTLRVFAEVRPFPQWTCSGALLDFPFFKKNDKSSPKFVQIRQRSTKFQLEVALGQVLALTLLSFYKEFFFKYVFINMFLIFSMVLPLW